MARWLIVAVFLLVVIIGGLVVLAGRDTEQPPVRVEKVVPLDNLAS